MSKKQVFELRLASRNKDSSGLIIGKFPEPIVTSFQACSQASDEVHMYVKEEEVKEDDVLEVTSTNQHEIAEAKALEIKNSKRKKYYRAKSEIVLEQDGNSNSDTGIGSSKKVNWVGNRVDTTVEATAASTASAGPKYAILQIMSTGVGDKIQKHVNVIHVGDWFSFSRPSKSRVIETLDDVNAKFEARQRSQQESNKRYNKLLSGYRNSSKRGGDDDDDEKDTAADDDEVPSAFGKTSSSRATLRPLTEDGVDLDGAEDNHWQDVDMEARVSDDEDDTGYVQAEDNEQEERTADVIDAYINSSGGESDDDDDQDDDIAAAEEKEKKEQAQASLEHLEGGAGQLQSAIEFKQKVLVSKKGKAAKDSGNKRKLDEVGVDGGGSGGREATKSALASEDGAKKKKSKHVSIVKGEVTSKSSPKYTTTTTSSSSGGSEHESNVRAYILRHGGKVQSKVLIKEFKKSIPKDSLRSILIKVTKKEEDSILGTMLLLK